MISIIMLFVLLCSSVCDKAEDCGIVTKAMTSLHHHHHHHCTRLCNIRYTSSSSSSSYNSSAAADDDDDNARTSPINKKPTSSFRIADILTPSSRHFSASDDVTRGHVKRQDHVTSARENTTPSDNSDMFVNGKEN